MSLEAKEGLALIMYRTHDGYRKPSPYRGIKPSKVADICAAMSFEALNGVLDAFDENINLVRPHVGNQLCKES